MIYVVVLMVACGVFAAFLAGRTYERKQFVRVGKPLKTTQEVLGVFKK